eukprot:GAHX01004193.1.p1 GENE.GAHX01004193.1~~GAHX01004193.1.p1  ORF type:complete len:217 (-),score=17.07 GAHX01004193.1:345-995(-)
MAEMDLFKHGFNEKYERDNELGILKKVLRCSNRGEIDVVLSKLRSSTRNYYNEHWKPIKDEFIDRSKPNKINLGLRTTNRVESYFSKLKKFANHRQSIEKCIYELTAWVEIHGSKVDHKINNAYMRVETKVGIIQFPNLKNELTNFGYEYFMLLYGASKCITRTKWENDNECLVCNDTWHIGLPCMHQMSNGLEENELLDEINVGGVERICSVHII